MSDLTHLSLFSGIGGLDLAAEWAGFRTVGQCEWADYPRAVLEKHWPGLPRWRDIRTLTGDDFFAKTGLRTVTVLSGGFPCQPFSTAGKRRGKDDDRYLWPEMLRVIQEIRPAWVVGENVAGIVSMALDTVLSDLESIGYACQALVIPACAVDAPHRRDRVAIVGRNANRGNEQTERQICAWEDTKSGGSSDDVPNSYQVRCGMRGSEGEGVQRTDEARYELIQAAMMFPTPTARCGQTPCIHGEGGLDLAIFAKLIPTVTTGAGMCGGSANYQRMKEMEDAGVISQEERRSMAAGNGGQLNPTWVEWLMGFPLGWTDLSASETPSCPSSSTPSSRQ